MANTKPQRYPYTCSFRCTLSEADLIQRLTERHADRAREAGFDVEESAGALIRSLIRDAAKAADMVPNDGEIRDFSEYPLIQGVRPPKEIRDEIRECEAQIRERGPKGGAA